MKIKGTKYNSFEIGLGEVFEKGDFITYAAPNTLVIEKSYRELKNGWVKHVVYEELDEAELKTAINHFRFLTQNLDLVRI